MKKLLPIGLSDFKELIERNYYYVDKTLLIKDVDMSGKVVLLPRPRRFGKTLNISMLRYFFEKSQEHNRHLFENLVIWKEEKYRSMQGQFPVVMLTFKSAVYTTYSNTYEKLAAIVAAEFNRHEYLLEGNTLKPFEKELFEKIRQSKASEVEFTDSLEYLVKFLHRYHKSKVVVLIDEYDVPVQSAFIHGFYDEIIALLRPLLTSALKDNSILEKGVLTGILTLARSGIFTGLNNIDIFNLTHSRFAQMFGFTASEAEGLLSYYEIDDIDQIKQWYNGYIFGATGGIFNPWSMLKCIQNGGALEIYWANTSDNVLLKRLITKASPEVKSEFEELLAASSIDSAVEEAIVFPDLSKQQNLIWSLLLFAGYLTYSGYELKKGKKVCTFVIPNKEIQYLFEDLIRKIFTESVVGNNAHDLLYALLHGKRKHFQELLQGFVLTSMSSYDLPNAEPEKSYHLFVLGLLVMLSDEYEVKSNRESGLGRYDILIAPKDTSLNAVIIEFKKVSPGTTKTLEEVSQKALNQIIEKNYAQELRAKNIPSIIAYGIAFEGKRLFVSSKTLS